MSERRVRKKHATDTRDKNTTVERLEGDRENGGRPAIRNQFVLVLGCAFLVVSVSMFVWVRILAQSQLEVPEQGASQELENASEKSKQEMEKASEPTIFSFRIVQTYEHDPLAFTQGLLWHNGSMFESTGLNGRSTVREVRLKKNGVTTVVRKRSLPQKDFGEGLVYWKGQLLQLLWQTGEAVRWAVQAGKGGKLEVVDRFRTPLSDGWGLETDGESLLLTDSGTDLIFLDPETFALKQKLTINDHGVAVEMVNELEMVGGHLWGNVFGKECLARIDPTTASVTGWAILEGILDRRAASSEARAAGRDPPDVLNGIAWDPDQKRLFVTGKLWPKMYEIELIPAETDLQRARALCIPTVNIFKNR